MEFLYQYLWKNGLFGSQLPLKGGGEVKIIRTGTLNQDSGPDFFNARLDFGDGVWAGNVEIHVKASDWYRHGHDKDRAYDSVLLHIVGVYDKEVRNSEGNIIPTAEVTVPQEVCLTYARLLEDRKGVRCSSRVSEVSGLELNSWIDNLGIERLQKKSQRIVDILDSHDGDWERATFITLARGLGFSLNSEPMEQLARSIPLNYLGRHSDNLMQLEALLFGQAGLLDPLRNRENSYYQLLCREYAFLSRKYGLSPLASENWKYARTRPLNFPPRRIALLARILYGGRRLTTPLIETAGDYDQLEDLFGWELEGYWRTHRDFHSPEENQMPQRLSKANRRLLMINVAAPILYTYALLHDDVEMSERAIALLETLPPEQNSRIAYWKELNIIAANAFSSQALLHLRNEYCDRNRCRECRIGYSLLKKTFQGR